MSRDRKTTLLLLNLGKKFNVLFTGKVSNGWDDPPMRYVY